VAATPARLPVRRIGAPDAVHRVQRRLEVEVAAHQFHGQDGDVDVVEEVQVDVRDVEERRRILTGKADARTREIAPAEHAQGPLRFRSPRTPSP